MNGNFKAKCISDDCGFTKGKVYEFVNFETVDDHGKKRPQFILCDFKEWLKQCNLEIIEDSKLDRFAKGEIVLHTPTQEIYDKLMQWCDEKGIKWCTGRKASETTCFCCAGIHTCITNIHSKLQWSNKFHELDDESKIETLSLADFGEPKLKVVDGIYKCISAKDDWFTVGVLYEVKNGYITCDYGEKRETFRSDDIVKENRRNEFSYHCEISEPTPKPLSITIEFHGRETVAKLLKNGKPVKQAIAKCLPTDKFSEAVGSQLALARLFDKKQKDIPTVSKVNEVKRIAKAGEWIRYTRSDYSFPNDNRIFRVIEVSPLGELVYFVSNEKRLSAFPSDYVVLEGYKHVQ